MIVANLATYPARRPHLMAVIRAVAPQVDRLNLVLNEYEQVPQELSEFDNVVPVIPEHDTKDAGKFYPDVSDAEFVFLIDDDIIFPKDFVSGSIERFQAVGLDKMMGGYHGSLYEVPKFGLSFRKIKKWLRYREDRIADFRNVLWFRKDLDRPIIVDQIATNTALLRGSDMPPYAYMRDSQKFVDVRLAKWCFERGITPVCLPHKGDWIGEEKFEEQIYSGFTKVHLPHVSEEIFTYAFKIPGRGEAPKV